MLKIVMYHYVRDLAASKYPSIRGLDFCAFKRQLDYLQENFTVVTGEQVVGAYEGSEKLKSESVWLTFDDGYIDHFEFVYPELLKRGLQGSFFVPLGVLESRKLLDVNAIHYLLAHTSNVSKLNARLFEILSRLEIPEQEIALLISKYRKGNRFDDADTILFKRLLQVGLEASVREKCLQYLIQDFMDRSEADLAAETYMSLPEMRQMRSNGMFFGGHGEDHVWLDAVSDRKQEMEIEGSLNLLKQVGMSTENWVMCYPYGASNTYTRTTLEKSGASLGLTTEPTQAHVSKETRYLVPRFDTNDFPQ